MAPPFRARVAKRSSAVPIFNAKEMARPSAGATKRPSFRQPIGKIQQCLTVGKEEILRNLRLPHCGCSESRVFQ